MKLEAVEHDARDKEMPYGRNGTQVNDCPRVWPSRPCPGIRLAWVHGLSLRLSWPWSMKWSVAEWPKPSGGLHTRAHRHTLEQRGIDNL